MSTSDQKSTRSSWSIWIAWVTLNAFGFGMGMLIAGILTVIVFPNSNFIPLAIVAGLIAGLIVGLAQWLLLRQLTIDVGWWIVATGIGSAIGSPLGTITQAMVWNISTGLFAASLGSAIIGLVFGILQWLILRRKFNKAGIWVFATAIGSAAGSITTSMLNRDYLIGGFTRNFWAGIGFGIVTGLALVWLLRKSRWETSQTNG